MSNNQQAGVSKKPAAKQEAAKQEVSQKEAPKPASPKKAPSAQPSPANKPSQKTQNSKGITSERALAIALNHAGLSSNQISGLEIELDTDDGVHYFEVEFEVGDTDYEYEISADTGAILDVERD